MNAVFTISASGEHLDASTLALLAEVELDEMSIRALSEDLTADGSLEPPELQEALAADSFSNGYPWTTNGLLEAAKHLGSCDQCGTKRAEIVSSFVNAWQEPFSPADLPAQAVIDNQIATALAVFDETVTPLAEAAPSAIGKQQKSPGLLGLGAGAGKLGGQGPGTSGWKASGFGRAIGLRRNQVLIGFACLAIAVPLLLQLRPADQIGGVAMKTADTTAAAFEEAAAEEAVAETEAAASETVAAAMAAETAAAEPSQDARDPADSADSAVGVPAAALNQTEVETRTQVIPEAPAVANKAMAGASSDQNPPSVAETENKTDPIGNELGAINAASPSVATPQPSTPSVPSITLALPVAKPGGVLTPPSSAQPVPTGLPEPAAAAPSSAKRAKAKAVKDGTSPTATPKAAKAAPKTPAARPASAAVPSAATAAAANPGSFLMVDPSVLNLGNLGTDPDTTALVGRFRIAYDQATARAPANAPPSAATPAPASNAAGPTPSPGPTVLSSNRQAGLGAPVAAATAAPAVAPAPALAVGAEPAFSEPTTTSPNASTPSLDRCVTSLFGPTDRRVIAAASGSVGGRAVWVVRIGTASGTFDVIIEMPTCTDVFRQLAP